MCSRSTRSGPESGDQSDEVVTREEFQAFKESMREQLEEEREKRREAEARAERAWKKVEALSRKLDRAQEVIAGGTGNV